MVNMQIEAQNILVLYLKTQSSIIGNQIFEKEWLFSVVTEVVAYERLYLSFSVCIVWAAKFNGYCKLFPLQFKLHLRFIVHTSSHVKYLYVFYYDAIKFKTIWHTNEATFLHKVFFMYFVSHNKNLSTIFIWTGCK